MVMSGSTGGLWERLGGEDGQNPEEMGGQRSNLCHFLSTLWHRNLISINFFFLVTYSFRIKCA